MTATDALAVIAAALVSILATAVVARPTMSAAAKRGIALVLAVVLGAVAAIISGQITGIPESAVALVQKIIISAAAVVAAAQGFHRQLAGALGSLSAATSPTHSVVEVAPADDDIIHLDDEEAEIPRHSADEDEAPSVIPDGEGVARN
jgi:hypothetical protein